MHSIYTDIDPAMLGGATSMAEAAAISATDIMHARPVAVRRINLPSDSARASDAFHSELLALARLQHPNLAPTHNLFRMPDHYLLVSEEIQGEPIDQPLRKSGPIAWKAAVSLICQALDGLHHAHLHGVLHCDLRPSNLLVTRNAEVKIIGFEVTRGHGALPAAEFIGHIAGSPNYMPPEQIRGEAADCRVDVYAIGAVLYEIVTGRPLFDLSSDYEVMLAAVREAPVPPQTINVMLPDRLQAAILKALAKSPKERFQSAFEFRSELIAVLNSEDRRVGVTQTAAPAPNKSKRPAQVKPIPQRSPSPGRFVPAVTAWTRRMAARGTTAPPLPRTARPFLATAALVAVIAATAQYWLRQPSPEIPPPLAERAETAAAKASEEPSLPRQAAPAPTTTAATATESELAETTNPTAEADVRPEEPAASTTAEVKLGTWDDAVLEADLPPASDAGDASAGYVRASTQPAAVEPIETAGKAKLERHFKSAGSKVYRSRARNSGWKIITD